jgi:transcriptional regulator with XRE-family HTH domain
VIEEEIGRRLREIRRQRGMSLKAAAASSQGRFRTSTLGAYERGERAMAVGRLPELADLYGVSVLDLLPDTRPAMIDLRTPASTEDALEAFERAVLAMRSAAPGDETRLRAGDRALMRILGHHH